MQQVANGLWVMRFPLSLVGAQIGRTVTLIRLGSGKVIVHSTAPFAPGDVEAIRELGEPGWLVEATLFHDTHARAGRRAFPGIPYLAPDGFTASTRIRTQSLALPPADWAGEIDVLPVDGMPKVHEHVFLHRQTRTLIVADLVFNLPPDAPGWTRFFMRWVSGMRTFPDISRIFRLCIRDRTAFAHSLKQILACDFDRMIVGHGRVIEADARQQLQSLLERHGY